jgi:hypothetical protein
LSTAEQITSSPGIFNATFGSGAFAESVEIVIDLSDGRVEPLTLAIRETLAMWEAELF